MNAQSVLSQACVEEFSSQSTAKMPGTAGLEGFDVFEKKSG
jgi:hypothetical protein